MRESIVLDTNIVLDVFVFGDEAARPLRQSLEEKKLDWLATQHMRDELERVLAYPQIVARLAFCQLLAGDVMAVFDKHVHIVDVASKAPVTCSDADDQKFIDLAVAHRAALLSKDNAVTSMAKRLLALGVHVRKAL
ncbi:MAG: putative toxin-antitoxin system toxin component, PIN family [Pseudomonadota bacterium]